MADERFDRIVKHLQEALNETMAAEAPGVKPGFHIAIPVTMRGRIKVHMYMEVGGQHHEPHLHVEFADKCNGTFALDPPRMLAGECRTGFAGTVTEWIAVYRAELRDRWDAIQCGNPLPRLECTIE
jgi:hypothetical protein